MHLTDKIKELLDKEESKEEKTLSFDDLIREEANDYYKWLSERNELMFTCLGTEDFALYECTLPPEVLWKLFKKRDLTSPNNNQ